MTRTEAKMIAKELYKLIKKDLPLLVRDVTDEYLNTKEAAQFLGVSVHYIYKNIDDIPHTNIGKLHKFKKSALMDYLKRK